ncbi:MAG: hypothetical protein AAGL29_13480, partial [Bacteroidota bacterium]
VGQAKCTAQDRQPKPTIRQLPRFFVYGYSCTNVKGCPNKKARQLTDGGFGLTVLRCTLSVSSWLYPFGVGQAKCTAQDRGL